MLPPLASPGLTAGVELPTSVSSETVPKVSTVGETYTFLVIFRSLQLKGVFTVLDSSKEALKEQIHAGFGIDICSYNSHREPWLYITVSILVSP